MNRRFKKTVFRYDPMAYQGTKRFRPDAQPHKAKCDCSACLDYLLIIEALNPDRIREDELTGQRYVANAQVMTDEDKENRKSRLKWHDKNRPYNLENRQKSSVLWRGGVYTGFKAPVSAPVSAPVAAPVVQSRKGKQKREKLNSKLTAWQKTQLKRNARIAASKAKQIVSSAVKPHYKPTSEALSREIVLARVKTNE
jgi:hypothetical protein